MFLPKWSSMILRGNSLFVGRNFLPMYKPRIENFDRSRVVGAASALLVVLLAVDGCASGRGPDQQPVPQAQELNSDVSLRADREKLAEVRQQVPENAKKKNDEEAKYLEWMDGKNKPEFIRDKFSKWARDLRDDFSKRSRELRDRYSKVERENRDAFTKLLKRERDKISKSWSAERRKRFFDDQEDRRKKFFSEEREQRAKFESELRSKIHDFDITLDEKRKQFADRIKDYTERMRAPAH